MYPQIGDYIKATYKTHKNDEKVVIGKVKNVATMRTGAVLGFIETKQGFIRSVPWSLNYTKFVILKRKYE